MKKVLSFVTGALFNISVIAFAGTLLFQTLSQNGMIQENVLFPLLGAPTTETINTGKQPIRFKTWYTSVNDVINGNGDVAKAAQAEGTVLLKNDNNALPLNTSTDSVSLSILLIASLIAITNISSIISPGISLYTQGGPRLPRISAR